MSSTVMGENKKRLLISADILWNWLKKYKGKKKSNERTNVMRILDQKKIAYASHSYEPDATLSGEEIAVILNEDKDRVFKTLVQLLNCSNPEPFPV